MRDILYIRDDIPRHSYDQGGKAMALSQHPQPADGHSMQLVFPLSAEPLGQDSGYLTWASACLQDPRNKRELLNNWQENFRLRKFHAKKLHAIRTAVETSLFLGQDASHV